MQNHQKLGARILSLLLTAALVGTMLPATVFAAEGPAPLVATTRTTPLDLATNADITYIGTDGTTPKTANPTTTSITDTAEGWSWNLDNKTLTLSGANIDCSECATVATNAFGINLPTSASIDLSAGSESIVKSGNSSEESGFTAGIQGDTVIIKGTGKLTVNAGSSKEKIVCDVRGIDAKDVSVYGGELNITCNNEAQNTTHNSLAIEATTRLAIYDGKVVATSGKGTSSIAVHANKVLVSNGELNANTPKSPAIRTTPGEMQINGGSVRLKAEENGLCINSAGGVLFGKNATIMNAKDLVKSSPNTKEVYAKTPADALVITYNPCITFDSRGNTAHEPIEVKNDMTLPADPIWAGYTFDGWYDGIDGTDAAGGFEGKLDLTKAKALTANTTVYAKWTNGAKTVRTGELDLKDATETIDKLSSEGWKWDSTSKTLTLNDIEINSNVKNSFGIRLPDITGENVTVQLEGTKNKIVTTNDGSVALVLGGNTTFKGTGSIDISSAHLGINIMNAALSIDSGNIKVTSAQRAIYAYDFIMNGGELTVTAASTGLPAIDAYVDGGTIVINGGAGTVTNLSNKALSHKPTGKIGKKITNWDTTTVSWTNDMAKPSVSFDARNGTTVVDVNIGDSMTLPVEPTWTGYTFDGWYDGIDGIDAANGFEGKLDLTKAKALTDSINVYAKWTKGGKTVRTTPLDLMVTSVTPAPDQGWTWDENTSILTLDGATIDCSGNAAVYEQTFGIQLMNNYYIVLKDGTTNTVKAGASSNNSSKGICFSGGYSSGTATAISGKGILNVTSGESANGSIGIMFESGTLTISDATIIASSSVKSDVGVGIFGLIEIQSGTITATGTGHSTGYGIQATGMIMSGGTVTATGTATGTVGTEEECGIYGMGDFNLTGGTLSAKGKTAAIKCDDDDPDTSTDVINAENATVTGAAEEFETGVTATLTQLDTAVPVVFSFAKAVNFNARNGNPNVNVKINEGTGTITMPTNPTWGDYKFEGWYTGIDGKGTEFVNNNLTDSTTVYAKWTKNGKAVLTETLDLSTATENLSGEGWEWDNTTKTLTLSGMTLNSTKLDKNKEAKGILFPEDDCTIILVDDTENTVDVSTAKKTSSSYGIYTDFKLTIKTSGKGTPGKLNAIAGKATNPSIGIYADGGIVIESGNITATAGESATDNSVGMSADWSDIHIKGGTVTATGGKSDGDAGSMYGSFGLYGDNVQIDDGTVNATGGEAALSAGIVGDTNVTLNGGSITAKGNVAAVAALTTDGVIIDDIANVKVNDKQAKVEDKTIGGMTISTLLGDGDAIVTDAKIKFKPSYTGTNPLAPNAPKATKTDTSITLPTQTITGETVEYGIEKNNSGTITWQDEPTFSTLTADTGYKFYARVKENDNHKAGTTSDATEIKTKTAPTSVSVTVKDSGNNTLTSDVVIELKQGNNLIKKTDTAIGGKYILEGIPKGVYSLVITKGIAPSAVTITETVTVAETPVNVPDMKFLDGNKNTVVESAAGTPEVAVGGMNDLLTGAKLDATLTVEEKTAVDASGSVELKFKADVKTAGDVTADKDKIEGIAGGQKIDLLLDLSVLKTVKASNNTVITDGEKVTTLAGIIAVHLPIPAELQGKAGLAVYRMHGGKAEALGKNIENAKDGEYYTIDPSGEFMTVYVKNFSTYALGYDAFAVTISGGGTGASGNGKYSNGETVTINAGSKSGYSFNGWTVTAGPVVLASPSSASTTFIMPAEAVTVTASWTSTGGGSTTTTYRNTVNQPENGTVTVTPASPSKGQTVTITTKPDAGYVVNTVIVKDANGKTISVTEKGENSYTFVQPGSKATVEVTYKKAGTMNFTDVTANDWFYDAVMAATANGWFSGTSDTTFSPLAPTNRGMIATILHRMEGTPKANAASFNDVAADTYYANGIAWAETNSIVKGYGNGNYGPNDNITREQLAAILYRYAGYKGYDVSKTAALDSFADSKSVSGYAKEAMSWAVGSGLISGRGNNTLAPTATAARSEAAVILVRFEALFTK